MKLRAAIIALLLPLAALAQEENTEETWKPASAESQAYREYRLKTTTPPYGLAKVKALIQKNASSEEDFTVMPAKDYLSLTLREKFTYHMINPESYSQNCDVEPPIQDEHKKIFGHLPDVYAELNWSERQRDFLQANRDSVMAIIKESANRSKRLGLNYKMALVEINAVEMVPFLVEFFKRDHKDLDILTVLMELMEQTKYEPFIKSASHTKLYSKNSTYNSFLVFNQANEDLIIQRAMAMYNAAN
ncbi:hypothetical protein [Chitinophaga agri]|uniref:DUF4919 domain-containing protein n=1 Tax=Chitinophaga agri TaxID=2703787 RepID=A0A6B9ZPT4_9BACT|nr:hypothetical protein [Chitinophaga agri]QHS63464.1 hypothetical protein GWR21_28930 [Chitinophaga agri]